MSAYLFRCRRSGVDPSTNVGICSLAIVLAAMSPSKRGSVSRRRFFTLLYARRALPVVGEKGSGGLCLMLHHHPVCFSHITMLYMLIISVERTIQHSGYPNCSGRLCFALSFFLHSLSTDFASHWANPMMTLTMPPISMIHGRIQSALSAVWIPETEGKKKRPFNTHIPKMSAWLNENGSS